MKQEIISRILILRYSQGFLNPVDVNEHYLEKEGIIDEFNKLNRGMLRFGSLGTNIVFDNESRDEIRVQPTFLQVGSKNPDRINFIINKFKNKFGHTELLKSEFVFDVHFFEDGYPQSVFKKYMTEGGMELELVHFIQENIRLVMYSCGANRIHIKASISNSIPKQFSEFDFKKDLELERLHNTFNCFIRKDLKLE